MAITRKVGSFVWHALVGRAPEDQALLRDLGLRPQVIEDLLDAAIHPKAESHEGHLITVVHGLDLDYAQEQDDFEIATIELDVVIGKGWVVTHADHSLEVIRTVAAQVDQDPALVTTPCELVHLVLDTIVDEYEPFLEQFIPQRIDQIEDELFAERPSTVVRREIYLRRRDVIRLQRVAVPQAQAMRELVRLARTCSFACDDAPLFRDIADRLDRVASLTNGLRSELDSAFEHYLSSVANTQNEVMKVLTMVSAILLPMTVVAGIYGMNFVFMPELDERWGYPLALALMVLAGVVGFLYFRARGWIGRPSETRLELDTQQVQEIPVLGKVVRLPSMGARVVSRQAARLAPGHRDRYHRDERR